VINNLNWIKGLLHASIKMSSAIFRKGWVDKQPGDGKEVVS
jgi:hypothetical protein